MMKVGSHISCAKGYEAMGKQALKLGANTFAFFTRNPRGGRAKEIVHEDVEKFLNIAKENKLFPIVAHAPYTMNCAAADEGIRRFARGILLEDLQRMEHTPGNYYNFHPGSHVKQGVETGTRLIADALNECLWQEMKTTVLLETMAGKGTEIGRNFQELRQILDEVKLQEKLGICLDTCHVWDGGYDIAEHLDEVLEEFDAIIGLERLRAIHLNDSKNPMNSHKDRHARIGEGQIGLAAMERIINHPKLRHLPFILETPNDDEGWAGEITTLRSLYRKA